VPPGSVTVILGQSGSGKSTLLRAINHLERVDDGFIAIDGELIGYRQDADTLYELKRARHPASAASMSAWCSRTSTCSRT
jgi:ABC-type polar amino acid transport system ATPase subunit